MSYNNYMYAVDRSDEYLAHYGIKGMKWGVQKAKESGNERKLDRQYRKAQRKLAKLKKRAENGQKYAKRAAVLGASGALAGGAAVLGPKGIGNVLARGSAGMKTASDAIARGTNAIGDAMTARGIRGGGRIKALGQGLHSLDLSVADKIGSAGSGLQEWGAGNSIATKAVNSRLGNKVLDKVADRMSAKEIAALQNNRSIDTAAKHLTEDYARKMFDMTKNPAEVERIRNMTKQSIISGHAEKITAANKKAAADAVTSRVSNNAIARAGAAAVGAGLLGAAGYNAYRAATTKRAAKKAQAFESEMNKAFAGTKYANNGSNKKHRRR